MRKYRTKLYFGLITLILAVLIGLGLLLGQLFKSYYLNLFDARLTKESSLITTFIQENGGIEKYPSKQIQLFTDVLESRISIVDLDGNIIYDSGTVDSNDNSPHKAIIEDIFEERIFNQELGEGLEVGGGHNLHYHWSPLIKNGKVEAYLFLSTKLNEIQKVYRQIWWLLTISLGFALIIIIMLGTRITSRYTKPIESATKVAMELAKGNYRARTYENYLDETGMLSTSINILARNLQEMERSREIQQDRLGALIENMGSGLILIDSLGHISMINRTFKEIFDVKQEDYLNKIYYEVIEYEDVTKLIEEIFMTEQKVRRQMILPLSIERRHFDVYGVPIIGMNDVWKGILLVFHDITELKKLEQVRKDFVANVSHELKTPITSIKGFSETLLDGAMNDKNTLEAFLNIILKESERLQNLIQDLLDLSKIEQQGYSLTLQKCNIIQLLEEVLPILNGKTLEKNIQIDFDRTKDEIIIEGDTYRLKQVFINLITNAITYTPNGGRVLITVQDNKDTVLVNIKDTGIGIEKSEIPRIFERFYRVDKARSRNSGGTGLGLAIVKHIVEAHKGQISVESEIGEGTVFIIELQKKISNRKD